MYYWPKKLTLSRFITKLRLQIWPHLLYTPTFGSNEDCRIYYGSRFDELKKETARKKKEWQRKRTGTRKELDKQKEKYAADPGLRERKKKRYEEGKEEQKIWEQKQKEKRKMASAQDHLTSAEGKAWEKNSKVFNCRLIFLEWFLTKLAVFETLENIC